MEIKLGDELLDQKVGKRDANQLREDIELIEGVYGEFSQEDYLAGRVAPVFFGSASNNFGVRELLNAFCDISPEPIERPTNLRVVRPEESKFSGFVFKIHANLDPRHRDRIAFLRICSGKFERGKFYHHVRLDKDLRFSNPVSFMADSKNVVEDGFPGDVIGLYDTGTFKIGDTLTEGEELQYAGIPSFSPEIFKELLTSGTLPVYGSKFSKSRVTLISPSMPTSAPTSSLPSLPLGGRSLWGCLT